MLHKIKALVKARNFMFSSLGRVCIRLFWYSCLVRVIAVIHLILIAGNVVSIGCLIVTQPFYIWLPIATIIISPVMGGSHCFLNRLENYYRVKAAMPLITDRVDEFLRRK